MTSTHPGLVEQDPPAGTLPPFGPPFVRFVHDRFSRIEHALNRMVDRLVPRDEVWSKIATGTLDGSGNGTVQVYTVAPDEEIFFHRMFVTVTGATFAAPVTGSMVEIQVDGQTEDGVSLSVGLPQVFTASSSAGIPYRGGEQIAVKITGSATVSATATVIVRGRRIKSHIGRDAN